MRTPYEVRAPGPSAAHLPRLVGRRSFRDGLMTFDQRTIDGTGAFLLGELERLDQTLHDPLVAVTWSRDIDVREDVTIADEASSFTNSTFASASGMGGAGIAGNKAWISKDADAITGISLDIGKTANPLSLWGMEVKFTIPELESAMKLGRPVDQQKYDGMQLKHQMDIDAQVYVGDTILNFTGMLNSSLVTAGNVVAGAQGSTLWTKKTPDEILADVNTLLTSTWAASGYAVMPAELRLPPNQFSFIVSQKVSNAGNVSILEFLRVNSMCNAANGKPLNIQPIKWLVGAGAGGTLGTAGTVDRMVAYTRDKNRVRFPMTLLQRTPIEYRSIYHITTYFARLGVIEFVYPETLQYADGL
jgi:hypothetical protein